MMDNNLSSTHIAGAGTVAGGSYNEVTCSGSASIAADIKCKYLSGSGSVSAHGNIDCEGSVKISGAFSSHGDVKAEVFKSAGAVKIKKSLTAKEIEIAGALKVLGDMSAEEAELHGAVHIEGLLNVDKLYIRLDEGSFSSSKVGTIGGSCVTVKASRKMWKLFGKKYSILETNLIEADKVDIENTHADTVRTIDALIGDGCKIGTLEYSGEAKISEKAEVENLVRI